MNKEDLFKKLPSTIDIKSKILLLTHTDADAAGATIIIKSIFNDVFVKHCSNITMSNEIKNAVLYEADMYDYIIVCDISCNEFDAEIIDCSINTDKLILIDHHITSLYLNKYKWACVESTILSDSYRIKYYKDYYKTNNHKDGLSSGSSLLFDYMEYIGLTKHIVNIELLKKMIHLITAYDTWDWFNIFNKDDIYNKFQSLCSLYGIELFEESLLTKLKNPNETNIFNDTDNLLLTIKRNKIENYMKNIDKSFYTGELSIKGKIYKIMYCFTNSYLQETFERMKSLDPTIDIYLINYGTGIALRSVKDDINVGDIAKLYGGGGHLGAGGFKISSNDQKKYLENALKTTITINEVWW